jgi:hypothetical protein
LLLAASPSHAKREASGTPAPARSEVDPRVVRSAAGKLASVVNDLQAARNANPGRLAQSVGDLWLEVGRLKREGRNVRAIEWYASDLERSLRAGQQDAVSRRRILDNLSYEIERAARE